MKQLSRTSKVALLLLALALPALAAQPIIVENPFPPSLSIPAAKGCGTFDVVATPEAGKPNGGEAILFANGDAILAGPVFVTLTNLSTGKNINLNISGPTKFIVETNTDVLVNLGLSLVSGNNPINPPNLMGIALANGRLVSTFDKSGNLISRSFTGTATNLCSLLQ